VSVKEIKTWLQKIENEYDPIALKMCSFNTITGKKLYFLPRKLETRLMVYRKSKIIDAVKNWHRFKPQLNEIVRKENGYGLPKNFHLESDVNKWDYYDLLVLGYYLANTEYNGKKTGRMAHRSKDYEGTVLGLIDRALQLGASKEDIYDMYKFSEAIIDMLQWEAIFRKYNLYCGDMWEGDGLSGTGIYEGLEKDNVYLTWLHQLDCLLLAGSHKLGIRSYINDKKDLGIAVMPKGVSFELTKEGLPKRSGTRQAHTAGWFWSIPKNSPDLELAYKLVMFINSYTFQLRECENFFLIPINKRVKKTLKGSLQSVWVKDVYNKSVEQLQINGRNIVPRFKAMADYHEFLDRYYDAFEEIVIKNRYSNEGPKGRVDREFIRKNIK